VGDTVELPELKAQKKVKSMQMFRCAELGCGTSCENWCGVSVVSWETLEIDRQEGVRCITVSLTSRVYCCNQAASPGVQPRRSAGHLRHTAGCKAGGARPGLHAR
jgi:hypothetical protein